MSNRHHGSRYNNEHSVPYNANHLMSPAEPKNRRCIRCKGYLSFMSARIVLSCFPVSHRVGRFIAVSGNAVGVGF
jgi:hypothetical protein